MFFFLHFYERVFHFEPENFHSLKKIFKFLNFSIHTHLLLLQNELVFSKFLQLFKTKYIQLTFSTHKTSCRWYNIKTYIFFYFHNTWDEEYHAIYTHTHKAMCWTWPEEHNLFKCHEIFSHTLSEISVLQTFMNVCL